MASEIRLIPHGDRLIVVYDDLVKTTTIKDAEGRSFTVHNPEVHSERSRLATIKAVGDDPETQRKFKVGDRILVSWHSGVRIHLLDKIVYGRTWNEDLLRMLRTDEVLALVLEEQTQFQ